MSTEEQHAVAVIAALNAASAAAYDIDDLKTMTTLPNSYTEVTVSPRFGAPNRNPGSTGRTGWRITTRAVAKTVSNAREMRKRADVGLKYARLTVAGDQSTPIQPEGAEPIGGDDGWFSGLTTYTYAI